MFLLAHVRSRDGAHDQENAPMSPDPFPCERLGSGNETMQYIVLSLGEGLVRARVHVYVRTCGSGYGIWMFLLCERVQY